MKTSLADIEVYVHFETEKAFLVSDTGDKEDAQWIPKTKCEVDYTKKPYATLTCEEWLAQEKGWI